MAPNTHASTVLVTETATTQELPKPKDYKLDLKYGNIIIIILIHAMGLYGLPIFLFYCKWQTFFSYWVIGYAAALGVTGGAHRLWTHRSYKARLPLRILLAFFGILGVQNHIYDWVRDHRVHHKYAETDADPHNIKRGFFFAHCGWLMCKKHPDVVAKGKSVDLSDLEADPVVRFQRKYYAPLAIMFGFVLPTILPWYWWGETLSNAFFVHMFQYISLLNGTWSVNSLAHMVGDKPYDKSIYATQNRLVSLIAIGEGFHNFHHVFPYDYSTSEWRWSLNLTTLFIDSMAYIGQAYDRKSAPIEQVRKRMERTGSHAQKVNHD